MDITIRIAGEAGQGIQTIGNALCRAVRRSGWNLFADQDYMSRVRGGNNVSTVRISDRPIFAPKEKTDLLVALDAASVSLHGGLLQKNALVIADAVSSGVSHPALRIFDVPLGELAGAAAGMKAYVNSACLGVIAGILRLETDIIRNVVTTIFDSKGDEVMNRNVAAMINGYQFSAAGFASDEFRLEPRPPENDIVINGSDAVALGAIHAGCKFYTAYPMSPSTDVMNVVAYFANQFGIVVEQAEDEIAAINMVIGASFAGVRAMTGTSGGGFALMGEGLSLAAMTETPVVVLDAQRPAPATGFPTRTEQADLDFILHAGHGEFARVVYAPGTIEEAFHLTVKAFDMADKYQIPVIIMSDQHLADSYRNVKLPDVRALPRTRYLTGTVGTDGRYKRYLLTDSGISPRAAPSFIDDVIYADSDEHTEAGHITEDALVRTQMVRKRLTKKMGLLAGEVVPPTASGIRGARIILVGFGSTFGVLKEVSDSETGGKIGFIHFSQVWPFPSDQFRGLLAPAPHAHIISVENNATGQLARLIRRETGSRCFDSILKYDGRPFLTDEIINTINQRYPIL